MKTTIWMFTAVAGLISTAAMAQSGAAAPTEPVLAAAVMDYLKDYGDLCVGKFTWPRDVTEEDRQAHRSDAVQLPVLERLGLVTSVDMAPAVNPSASGASVGASAPAAQSDAVGSVRRYSLTAKGSQFYLRKKKIVLNAQGHAIEIDGDFCPAHLSLDKVIKWTSPGAVHGRPETVVSFTYAVESADWMADAEARKVFPVVDRVVRGKNRLLMAVTVQSQDGKWVPVLPGQ